jgi:hypothetical protein
MGQIKVNDAKGNVLYTINTDASGTVTNVKTKPGADVGVSDAQLKQILNGVNLGAGNMTWELGTLLEKLGQVNLDAKSSTDVGGDSKKLALRITALDQAIEKMKGQHAGATDAQKAKLEAFIKTAEAQLKQMVDQLKGFKDKSGFAPEGATVLQHIASKYNGSGTSLPGATAGKAQVTSGGAQTQGAQAGAAQQPGTLPGAGKAQGLPNGQFDVGALMQSNMFQTANLNSLDQLGKTQMDQKKMMMLFMYFAMQAMSGDMGAMTAFMQFITTIILKDKSMQNVNMANKLIELEDASRKATDQLLNTASYDPNNPQVAADFGKVMERVKADQGSIATSQKLIAQMMEEFAQVSEFLNNLQKSLLDVRGRLLSRMSSFNA